MRTDLIRAGGQIFSAGVMTGMASALAGPRVVRWLGGQALRRLRGVVGRASASLPAAQVRGALGRASAVIASPRVRGVLGRASAALASPRFAALRCYAPPLGFAVLAAGAVGTAALVRSRRKRRAAAVGAAGVKAAAASTAANQVPRAPSALEQRLGAALNRLFIGLRLDLRAVPEPGAGG